MRSPELRLGDILDAISKIIDFTREGRAYFLKDVKTQSAVFHEFEVIGEATKNLPRELRRQNPEVPWDTMAKMRDLLIHIYFVADPQIVWRVISTQLPSWRMEVEQILKDLENKGA